MTSSDRQRSGTSAAPTQSQPLPAELTTAGAGMLGNVLPGMPASLASGPLHASV